MADIHKNVIVLFLNGNKAIIPIKVVQNEIEYNENEKNDNFNNNNNNDNNNENKTFITLCNKKNSSLLCLDVKQWLINNWNKQLYDNETPNNVDDLRIMQLGHLLKNDSIIKLSLENLPSPPVLHCSVKPSSLNTSHPSHFYLSKKLKDKDKKISQRLKGNLFSKQSNDSTESNTNNNNDNNIINTSTSNTNSSNNDMNNNNSNNTTNKTNMTSTSSYNNEQSNLTQIRQSPPNSDNNNNNNNSILTENENGNENENANENEHTNTNTNTNANGCSMRSECCLIQ